MSKQNRIRRTKRKNNKWYGHAYDRVSSPERYNQQLSRVDKDQIIAKIIAGDCIFIREEDTDENLVFLYVRHKNIPYKLLYNKVKRRIITFYYFNVEEYNALIAEKEAELELNTGEDKSIELITNVFPHCFNKVNRVDTKKAYINKKEVSFEEGIDYLDNLHKEYINNKGENEVTNIIGEIAGNVLYGIYGMHCLTCNEVFLKNKKLLHRLSYKVLNDTNTTTMPIKALSHLNISKDFKTRVKFILVCALEDVLKHIPVEYAEVRSNIENILKEKKRRESEFSENLCNCLDEHYSNEDKEAVETLKEMGIKPDFSIFKKDMDNLIEQQQKKYDEVVKELDIKQILRDQINASKIALKEIEEKEELAEKLKAYEADNVRLMQENTELQNKYDNLLIEYEVNKKTLDTIRSSLGVS